jgi:hypothetical protein
MTNSAIIHFHRLFLKHQTKHCVSFSHHYTIVAVNKLFLLEGPDYVRYGFLPVSQVPDSGPIPGAGRLVDLHLKVVVAKFAMIFQLNLDRHVLNDILERQKKVFTFKIGYKELLR